ncbi:biliverdin-producing heme oxygenase [Gordonia sp. HY002]|uniref:biliverdin-producing heme oxygenase n=1 Tax=Gordonia zhenghanii TaxID=2911516 RepID=UPI001EF020E2|nr:biliverdin-producing heme oxygenase [Gordonia zhenghanii]MCF8570279.1 biliverdin-producing heme oxygenase [Gordonia zhenghanii]MCF8605538.1 biliverdin-producing heme oxygenase [Gordonia zhenghanii]
MTTASLAHTAPQDTLSAAMKKGSAVEHDQAEGSSFMAALLGGRMDADGYIAYLQRLRVVYAALESTAATLTDDPIAAPVIDPALDRLAAIDADLAHWAPAGLPTFSSPAATAYADRITGTASWSGAFVAHHYTRYLGDLSGGQAIGRILDRTFDLDGGGIAFYAFDEVGKVKPYKDRYRDRLDAIGEAMSEADRDRLVDEVRFAFTCNQALFAELSELHPGR